MTVAAADRVAALARTLADRCVGVVDVDELVAAIEATGVNDRVAQQRYGQPTVFALGEAVLSYLHKDASHQQARQAASAVPPARPAPYVRQAVLRCALYLTPMLLALATAAPLGRVAWTAPAAALVIGWASAQALAYLAHFVCAHHGPGPATRLLGVGFLALAAAWSGLLAVAPESLVGSDRTLAYVVTLAELAFFAAVAAALVTRAEFAVLCWTLPSWAVAVAAVAGWWPAGWPVRPEALLLGGIALTFVRAFRHLYARASGHGARIGGPEVARALAYLIIGLGQSLAFVLVWRAAPGGRIAPPAAVPLLAAVPMIEVFVGWHTAQVAVGLEAYDDRLAYHRDLRRVATLTIAALLLPHLAGTALSVAAYRLPYGISTHPDARGLVLALASGVLLAGVFAVVLLLATRRQVITAALLASAPVVLTVAVVAADVRWGMAGLRGGPDDALWSGCASGCALSGALLPTIAVALMVVYAIGLILAGHTLFDPRSYR